MIRRGAAGSRLSPGRFDDRDLAPVGDPASIDAPASANGSMPVGGSGPAATGRSAAGRSAAGRSAAGRSAAGLTAAEVAERVADGRVNDVPARSSRSLRDIIRANVLTRINAIIGVLLVFVVIVGPFQDALFGGVIIVNTLVGLFQELRATGPAPRTRPP